MTTENPEHVLAVALDILDDVLPKLRMLTIEGWNLAYAQAISDRTVHTSIAGRIRMAKSLSAFSDRRFGSSD